MDTEMELLLHYVWQHRLYDGSRLSTTDGKSVEVIDAGLHNTNAGPDFFNAKVRIGGTMWVGNVEIHDRASDWLRHGHTADTAYNNVILHVVGADDYQATTAAGEALPQMVLSVPDEVRRNYRQLLAEERYPPCWRVIPHVPMLKKHAWMSALTAERLEGKMQRLLTYLERTGGDWEQTFFAALARNFGFGVNGEAFEDWAFHIPPQTIVKHRDDLFQVEAFFMGQAGLLEPERVSEERRDDYYTRLLREYRYLQHKFSLTPMDGKAWRFLRLRPQNFPYIRLSQFATLYSRCGIDFSRLIEAQDAAAIRRLLHTGTTDYWSRHYTFGKALPKSKKSAVSSGETPHPLTLSATSLDLLIINTAAPLLFTYGRKRMDETLCERAFQLLEQTAAEHNFITRSWELAGLGVENAADSQALIQLKKAYCDRKDCLRCRFGAEYLCAKGLGA